MNDAPALKVVPDTDALGEANAARLAALAEQGINLDPFAMLKSRLDLVTGFIANVLAVVTNDPTIEGQLEHAWESGLGQMLDAVEAQAQAARLTAGLPSGLIVPGQ